jgi:hypothetical protein
VTDDIRTRHLAAAYEANAAPCPRCLSMAMNDALRLECVMPLFSGADAPLAVDGSGPCCIDCGAADTVVKVLNVDRSVRARHMTRWRMHPRLRHDPAMLKGADRGINFGMARVAVGNDRQESMRLPGVKMGLAYEGWVRVSQPGEWQAHVAWMDRVGLHQGDDHVEV